MLLKKIKDDFGRIDVLCSVAGIFLNETPISIQKDTEWNDVIETNLTGVMRCLRSSWPLFRRGASIVTVDRGFRKYVSARCRCICSFKSRIWQH